MNRKIRIALWVPPVAWAALILTVSSLPGVDIRPISFDWGDKLAHLAEYAVLGFLLARMFFLRKKSAPMTIVGSLLLGAGLAAADELHQIPIPNRYCEFGDFAADVLGGGLGLLAYSVARKVRA